MTEAVDILADHAPTLLDALQDHDPNEFLILGGTLIRTDRVAADEPYYSQKHRHHGMNVAVLARPDGTARWYSRALPGRTHDPMAARAHGVVQACLTRQILVLADRARSALPTTAVISGRRGRLRSRSAGWSCEATHKEHVQG